MATENKSSNTASGTCADHWFIKPDCCSHSALCNCAYKRGEKDVTQNERQNAGSVEKVVVYSISNNEFVQSHMDAADLTIDFAIIEGHFREKVFKSSNWYLISTKFKLFSHPG